MRFSDRDVMYVQNPAIGAALLWRFICGYYSNESRPIPFPLLFVVLPIVFRQDLCTVIKGTQKASGLSKVSEKLFSGRQNDSIHYVNTTAIQMRGLTLEAFNIAVEANLVSLSAETATVFPPTTTARKYTPKGDCKDMMAATEKLGAWCSELTLLEIAKWLKVRF
ncbi:three component ABC system middle component [Dehalococcoides mccartyi]|uniref:three component ABC system middle component n=1 Tax=Dehalococcoides mccartyi TaxID=61435 RepID=UPI0026EC3D62|nr:three component ABC system middle component [Dehalococcoides mccartyi]